MHTQQSRSNVVCFALRLFCAVLSVDLAVGDGHLRSLGGAKQYCPGNFSIKGLPDPQVSLIPTGWTDLAGMQEVKIDGNKLTPHMDARAYFAQQCNAGEYNNEDYLAVNLLDKTLRYTVDLANTGCGCNVAFYLVSMHQNKLKSTCKDYYCDANSVCGVPCAEIDIMEANEHAWHSTLHTQFDHSGMGGGLGGGDGWTGPRDWSVEQYSPGGSCIDTKLPFEVAVSFPTSSEGILTALELNLSQTGKPCDLKLRLSEYAGLADLGEALRHGMTPVVSYWASDKMLWLDGAGPDNKGGPCHTDKPASCPTVASMSNFTIEDMAHPHDVPAGGSEGGGGHENPKDFEQPTASPTVQASCPGTLDVNGVNGGGIQLIPTGWGLSDPKNIKVNGGNLTTTMGSRAYFADSCTAGTYDNKQYTAFQLLGKTLHYNVDLSAADCGCNSALYLVSMRQNDQQSDCNDFYCDANSVCGIACAEIDIQEANMHAWHSTLHTKYDHGGMAAGLGGGDGWNGPRDFSTDEYGPGSSCIDTKKPFHVAASFPVDDDEGILTALEVELSQSGHDCKLNMKMDNYEGMDELTVALRDGMTPVVSYWNSHEMLWMDGSGSDRQGFCQEDHPSKCGDTVTMYNFSVTTFEKHASVPKKPEEEGICEGEWLVQPKCVLEFTNYDGKIYRGCTDVADKSRYWCSHDDFYQGRYSYCEPCKVEVADRLQPLFADEDLVINEDNGGHEGDATTPKPGDKDQAKTVVEPYQRCNTQWQESTECIEGFYCKKIDDYWSQCSPKEVVEIKDCFNGWKPAPGCARVFDYDDTEYTGCTMINNEDIGWCAYSPRYNGAWANCTRCDDDSNVVMQKNAQEPLGSSVPWPALASSGLLGLLLWVVPLLTLASLAAFAMSRGIRQPALFRRLNLVDINAHDRMPLVGEIDDEAGGFN